MALLSVVLVGLVAGASGEACAEGTSEEQSLLSLPPKMPAGQLQSSSSEEANDTSVKSQRLGSGIIRYDNSWSNPHSNNFCLSVTDNDFKEGNHLQLWDCVWSSGQTFTVQEHQGKHQLAVGGYTVGFPNGKWNGAAAKLSHGQAFFWDYGGNSPGMLKTTDQSEMCLTVDGNNAYNGAKVQLWKCHEGSDDQKKWSFQKGGSTHAPCAHAGQDVYDDYTFKGHTPVNCCDGKPAANYNGKMLCPGGPTHAPSPPPAKTEAPDGQIWCNSGQAPSAFDGDRTCAKWTCDEKNYISCCMMGATQKQCWGHGCLYHCGFNRPQ